MEVAHQTAGSGPPIVLLSGWLQPGERWRRVRAALVERYTVVTIDNRETGASGPSPDAFAIHHMAQDVLDVADGLRLDRFTLAGISMGGRIAQDVVGFAPERVGGLALFATWPRGPMPHAPDFSVLLPAGEAPPAPDDEAARRAFQRGIWSRLTGPGFAAANPDVIEAEIDLSFELPTPLPGLLRQLQAIQEVLPAPDLPAPPADLPVAIVHGDHDALVAHANGAVLAERIGRPLTTWAGAGHMLEFERPEAVAQVIAGVAG